MNPTEGTEMTTETITYVDHNGEPYDERSIAVIEQTRERLMSGRYFALVAASGRSARGYRPCSRHDSWAHVIETLGRMAGNGPQFAQIAQAIVGSVPLYQTNPEMSARVYEAATAALAKGYDDVVGRSGPEAGRYSDHHHEFGINVRVALAFWLAEATALVCESVPTVGWCVQTIARAERVRLTPSNFPSLRV